jgi:hypothetical protein
MRESEEDDGMNAEKERRRQVEQAENAKREIAEARTRRAHKRVLRDAQYGILDRKDELSRERLRVNGLRCTCGAIQRGGMHDGNCPVVVLAKTEKR